jgi:phage tail-like protein
MVDKLIKGAHSTADFVSDVLGDGVGGYPPTAFYFKVSFAATLGMDDTSFQEVSGISSEMTTEEVIEGGENRYVHKLPTAIKHSNLELKRGIAPMTSPLVRWCRSVMEADFIIPIVAQPIIVSLMNKYQVPIRVWTFANAFPVKWEVDGFSSTKNEVAIEKIVLSYTYSNRMI